MPALSQIVTLINTSLKTQPFTGMKYQRSMWSALADAQKTTSDESTRPVIIDNTGQETDLSIDDKYNLQVYHCIEGLRYGIANEKADYGDPGTVMEENAEMEMIFYGDRVNINLRPEDIIAGAMLWFPKELTPAQATTLSLTSVIIETSHVDTDSMKVFATQYHGKEYRLKPSQFMCSIKYRIISTFNKSCYQIC